MKDYATVNEYYDLLGLPTIDGGDKLGWSTAMNFDYYWQLWIDFSHSLIELEDGTKCHSIWMMHEPSIDFEEYY